MRYVALTFGLCVATLGCGQETAIILELRSSYDIPSEVDTILLTVCEAVETGDDQNPYDCGEIFGDFTVNLKNSDKFPYRIKLTPEDGIPQKLLNVVELNLGTTNIYLGEAPLLSWEDGAFNEVTVNAD